MTESEPLLEIDRLSAGYGDLRAVWDLSLSVYRGQTTLLLGRNGAGKTTSLMACAGLVDVMGGTIRFQGGDLGGSRPYARTARGLAFVQEGKRVFKNRTVEENLLIGGWTIRRHRRKLRAALAQAFDRFPALRERRNHRAGALSGGQQQMLAIAQALMPEPAVLMLDEPSAGLAPVIVREVLALLGQLTAEGLGILLVEQLVDEALRVADHVTIIEHGRGVISGAPSDIDVATIRDVYLGDAAIIGKEPGGGAAGNPAGSIGTAGEHRGARGTEDG
jgi:branched-chain amino acid transport system ATP-binding protein